MVRSVRFCRGIIVLWITREISGGRFLFLCPEVARIWLLEQQFCYFRVGVYFYRSPMVSYSERGAKHGTLIARGGF